jgi:hypothetical protein
MRLMARELKIYGDTNTLPSNTNDARPEELAALRQLWADKKLSWLTSHLVSHEAMNTKDGDRRNLLVDEHKARVPIARDEKVVGVNTQYLPCPYGGFLGFFLLSDVQDEAVRAEFMEHGLKRKDAEHIAQAVYNNCDVFLTLDKGIIKRRS